MQPDKWKEVKDVFNKALELEAEERAEYLKQACSGDDSLRLIVESLIEATDRSDSFLDWPVATRLLVDSPKLQPGKNISHYEIRSFVGEGGMGTVYRAVDTKLKRDVALKVLQAEPGENDRHRRFLREARAAAALDHPNICAIYEVGEDSGHSYIAMQYLEGETLALRMKRNEMTPSEALEFSIQIADALSTAHERNVIHRDIKPSNLILTTRGDVKVVDFGLAKSTTRSIESLSEAETTLLTHPGLVVGTVPYMSPEQARGQKVDGRSDIWSLGVVLYEMITGHQPFVAESAASTIAAILTREPPPVARYSVEVPAELHWMITKALRKDPEERYQTMKELLTDLKTLKHKLDFERSNSPEESGAATSFTSAIKAVDSIAVLPLRNLTGDSTQDYFVEGMHEALITELSKISALKVISRASTMRYKATGKRTAEIARELGVNGLIEGSVLRERDQVRISVQLIHGPADKYLWAESYQREIRSILVLQGEVASAVANEIRVQVTPQEQCRLADARSVNPEAYQLYLKGRYFWYKRTEEGFRKALEYFNQAIEKDPTYALPYAGLACTYANMGQELYGVRQPGNAFPRAKATALKALELEENLGEAHAVLAYTKFRYDWDFDGAEQGYKRALALNPSFAVGRIWYSHYLLPMGRVEESLGESLRAIELDPLGAIINAHLGWHYLYAGQYERAIEQLRKALELEPDFAISHLFLGQAYEQQGNFVEAIGEFQKAISVSDSAPIHIAALGHAYGVSGRRDEAQKILSELKAVAHHRYVSSYEIAMVYEGLGETEHALAWLEQASSRRDSSWLVDVNVDPRFTTLRSEPRFQDLLHRIGLAP